MKVKLGQVPWLYPIPITLVGAQVQGKPNFATIGDTGLVGIHPALVFVSSHREHYTNVGILANNTFSINIPNTAMLAKVDLCGSVSGRDLDKSTLFETFYGETGSAPMIAECPLNLECRVVKEFCLQHRQVFIGEVVQAYASPDCVHARDGRHQVVAMDSLDPIVYALDNRYYRIGGPIGTGYQEAARWKGEEG